MQSPIRAEEYVVCLSRNVACHPNRVQEVWQLLEPLLVVNLNYVEDKRPLCATILRNSNFRG